MVFNGEEEGRRGGEEATYLVVLLFPPLNNNSHVDPGHTCVNDLHILFCKKH